MARTNLPSIFLFLVFLIIPLIFCTQLNPVRRSENWVGFLPSPKESETVMDVANQFVRELQSRSFLTDFLDFGSTCIFKLHDLVRDLAVFVAKGEFQMIYPHGPEISENAQHLRFLENNLFEKVLIPTGLRSLFSPVEASDETLLKTLVSRCKYLRYLELRCSKYKSLPHSIGKLKHLRYLGLAWSTELKGLPVSLYKLQNLRCLALRGCTKLHELPKGLGKLINLRRLSITTRQPDFPFKEIASLTSLENLGFDKCDKLESLSDEIQLSSLKTLVLDGCGSLKTLSFHVIGNLENLFITNCGELELSMGLGNQIPDLRLKVLELGSLQQLVTLPRWLQGSANTLQSLTILDCKNLNELPQWLSTLICLKEIRIWNCQKLLSLPDNLHHLTNLEYLSIQGCPELWKRYQPEVGQDWHKISHIKKVIVEE